MDSAVLETQSVTIPLVAGLDLKTDSEAVQPPAMLELNNVSYFNPGVIAKDDGYPAIAAADACTRLVQGSQTSLIYHSDDRLREYHENGDAWRDLTPHASPLGTASAERVDDVLIDYQRTFKCGDYASFGDTEAIIYSDSAGNIRAQVREISTGVLITKDAVSELVVSAVTQAYVVTNDGYYVFAWTSAGNIRIAVWDPTTRSAGAPTNFQTDNRSGNAAMDLVSGLAAGDYWIAYSLTGGGRGIKVVRQSLHGGGTSTLTQGADTADQWIALGLDSSDGSVLCAYQSSTAGTKMFGVTSVAALRSASTIAAGDTAGGRGTVVCHNTPTGMIVYEKTVGAGAEMRRCLVAWAGSGGAASTLRSLFGQTLCHRALSIEGTVYVGLAYFDQILAATSNQRTLWTASIDGGDPLYLEPICGYLYDTVADPTTWSCGHVVQCTSSAVPAPVTEFRFLGAQIGQKTGDPATTNTGLILCKFRPYEGEAVGVRGAPYVSGQMVYSGPGPCNASFLWAPSLGTITFSNAGGAGLVAGQTYQWQACFVLRLPDGTVVRSPTSNVITGTVSGGNNKASIVVSVPIYRGIQSGLVQGQVEIYRTQAGPGATFTKTPSSTVSTIFDLVSTSLVDTASDASIASNILIYTTGGVLDAFPMPMVSNLCLHQNRLFAVEELSNEIRYTRDIVPGEPPCWHPDLAIAMAGQSLLGRALATCSNGLWVLGRDAVTGSGAIGILVGQGPDDTGASSSYDLQPIESADVGPAHWRQACSTPIGIFFEDPFQGFHVLATGSAPLPVGLAIEAQRARLAEGSQGTVLAMHPLQDRKEIRCLLKHDTSQTLADRILVYHYDRDAWSVRRALGVLLDATVWRGLHVQVADAGQSIGKHQFRRNAAPVFQDRGVTYNMSFGTGWFRTADFAGLQIIRSIYVIGKFKSAGGVQVDVFFDGGGDASAESYNFTDADIDEINSNEDEIRLRIRPGKRLCERFRIRVTSDVEGKSDSCEGIQWNAIRVDYGALRRGAKPRKTGAKG